jgi:predicted RND superfamily exporter protein
MWEKVAGFLLRQRILFIALLVLGTGFMLMQAMKVELAYDNPKFIPDDDPDYVAYQNFKKTFGDDGSVLVIGVNTNKIHTQDFFNDWYELTNKLDSTEGIARILSISNVPRLKIVETTKVLGTDTFTVEAFEQQRVVSKLAANDEEVAEYIKSIKSLRFYDGLLFNSKSDFTSMAVTLEKQLLDSKKRIAFVEDLVSSVQTICDEHGVEPHFSGLPYIRTEFSNRIRKELQLFTLLSLIITSIIILLFFRSLTTLLFSVLVVAVGVVWSFGILVLLGYKITMFIALLPPLIVVIGIANCIYLLNKYHDEYRNHGNKIKSLQRVVSKVGVAVFFTNLTTGIGFGVFVLTGSTVLHEFGLTAFLSVMSVFIISLILIPLIFSFLPPPKQRHTKHLESRKLENIIDRITQIVQHKRKTVYIVSSLVVGAAIVGMTLVSAIGYMVDDISKSDKIYKDLKFFEENIQGVMPFEIVIDTKTQKGITSPKFLKRIEYFETKILSRYKEFSKPVSISQIVSFAHQELNDGDPRYYIIPSKFTLSRIDDLFQTSTQNTEGGSAQMLKSLLDSSKQKARISVQMADVGSKRIKELKREIHNIADSVFNHKVRNNYIKTDSIISIDTMEEDSSQLDTTFYKRLEVSFGDRLPETDQVNIDLTGTSIIFLKGNDYLNKNLLISLLVAFLIIGLIMASIFTSLRMIAISLVPNVIPLLITAGIMGYFGVALKPSTVLVFSVAFGIAVDFTIHFLSKYRMELRRNNFKIQKAVEKALRETGVSMMYTAIILFFGFIIFAGSAFGGTIALGIFTSITLIVALLSNLILLPSLLLSYDLAKERKKSKKKPLIDYPDEEA